MFASKHGHAVAAIVEVSYADPAQRDSAFSGEGRRGAGVVTEFWLVKFVDRWEFLRAGEGTTDGATGSSVSLVRCSC